VPELRAATEGKIGPLGWAAVGAGHKGRRGGSQLPSTATPTGTGTAAAVDSSTDTSAILAFTEGSTAVGEAIAKVADEGCLFGLPVMCLAEAARSVTDTDRLDLLVNHPAAGGADR
jgi:hypothetical protein